MIALGPRGSQAQSPAYWGLRGAKKNAPAVRMGARGAGDCDRGDGTVKSAELWVQSPRANPPREAKDDAQVFPGREMGAHQQQTPRKPQKFHSPNKRGRIIDAQAPDRIPFACLSGAITKAFAGGKPRSVRCKKGLPIPKMVCGAFRRNDHDASTPKHSG